MAIAIEDTMRTRQEFYNLLVATSAADKFPAIDANKRCCNRTNDGGACVAGLCIPDNMYSPTIEGKTLHNAGVCERVDVPDGMTMADIRLLQRFHDDVVLDAVRWDHAKFVRQINAVFGDGVETAKL